MNTENIIEYIRQSHGLRCTKKSFWAMVCCYFVTTSLALGVGVAVGGAFKAIGAVSCAAYLAYVVFVIFFLRKKYPLKNRIIADILSDCCMLCLIAFMFAVFYTGLNMPAKGLGYYYLPLGIITVFLFLYRSFRLNKPAPVFSKKTPVKAVPLFHYRGRIALGTLILGVLFKCFGHLISERTFEYMIVYGALLSMYLMPFCFLDIQRYYYYTKLEKKDL